MNDGRRTFAASLFSLLLPIEKQTITMMDFRTKVELPVRLPSVGHKKPILLMGSCFAENIGRLLAESKFDVDINPFGILYNPLSVAKTLRDMLQGREYKAGDLFFYNDRWHSPMHHGSFSDASPDAVLERVNGRLRRSRDYLRKADWLMLTWGTAYVYEEKETGAVVSNCHKRPERLFRRRLLAAEETAEEYLELITMLRELNPRLKILFTVSPIRHARDGMHANQISKATLLLAADRLQQRLPEQVFYFPSYEIMMDELRDYRFYADDMLHPSPLAVRYLWECFAETFFSSATKQIIAAVEEIRRDLEHRPFHPGSEAYQRFLGQIVLKIERLNGKYPYLDFRKETETCHTRLNP